MLCPGVAFPFYSYSFEKNNDLDCLKGNGGGLGLHWVNYKTSGFSFKCDGLIGANIAHVFDNASKDVGTMFMLDFGFGYMFIRTPKTRLGIFGTTGFIIDTFSEKYDYSISGYTTSATHSFAMVPMTIGGDLFGSMQVSKRIGLFCNLGIKVPILGVTADRNEYEQQNGRKITGTTYKSIYSGGYCIIPTIGLSFVL